MKAFKNVLCIDPGVNTGLAYFSDSILSPRTIQFGTNAKTDEEKIRVLVSCLQFELSHLDHVKKIYIEGVRVWRNSVVSMTSATRGNLSLLAYIVGAYFAVFCEYGLPVTIVNPNWKGQMTYEALETWVFRANGHTYPTEHTLAAAAMGLKLAGKL